ncbi:MAG: tryptophan-rich sensory protein [Muribaculum sp.]|nr:tryptophan-rich sensory protein [Muribaculum sp.]
MKTKIEWKQLAANIAIALGAGLLSTVLAPGIAQSYETLYRPPLAPPGWVFPVVWSILYVLMGIASYLIVRNPTGEARRTALYYYGVQLVVNLLWPVIFFRFGAYGTAFFWLLLLWYLAFMTGRKFFELNRAAGRLFLPYLAWLTFAAYLNLAIAVAER